MDESLQTSPIVCRQEKALSSVSTPFTQEVWWESEKTKEVDRIKKKPTGLDGYNRWLVEVRGGLLFFWDEELGDKEDEQIVRIYKKKMSRKRRTGERKSFGAGG